MAVLFINLQIFILIISLNTGSCQMLYLETKHGAVVDCLFYCIRMEAFPIQLLGRPGQIAHFRVRVLIKTRCPRKAIP